MRISDWSSDVCSSDLPAPLPPDGPGDAVTAHDAGDLPADMAFEDGPPGDKGEFAAVLDDGVFAAGEFDGAAERAFHRLAGARLDKLGRASCRERVCPYV